jgi:16S rRNA (uracil1498-N3)-methyltransferase
MDWIVQKATELGVRRLVPVQADRSVPQLGNAGDAARRVARWRLLAIEAMKQCGSAWLPEIGMPLDVEGALGAGGAEGLALVGSFEPAARHPRQWFEAWRVERGEPAREVAVWVGPEGDYTPAERAALRAAGVRPITLGPLVLRSETAAVYCLSVLACELQAPGTGQ